jgi:hypothetical protein
MRVEVYWGGQLAAVLVYGRDPVYRGMRGLRAKRLLQHRRGVRNLWTGERAPGPRSDTREWWLSSISAARLTARRFTVVANKAPLAEALPPEHRRTARRPVSAPGRR